MSLTNLWGQTTFTNILFDSQHQAIMESKTDIPRYGTVATLHFGNLENNTWNPITFFPERIWVVGPLNAQYALIYNHFGLFRSNTLLNKIEQVPGFPTFNDYQMLGELYSISPSPDGKYVLYSYPDSPASGDLILLNIETGSQEIVAEDHPLRISRELVKWSPDSRYFIYARGSQLYYYAVNQTRIDENFRLLGDGSLNSVSWHRDNTLFYVHNSQVYHFYPAEIFIGVLYRDIFKQSRGKLFSNFRPGLDRFYVSPDKQHIAVLQGEGELFIQRLAREEEMFFELEVMPLVLFSSSEQMLLFRWTDDNTIIAFTTVYTNSGRYSRLYQLRNTSSGWNIQQEDKNHEIQHISFSPTHHFTTLTSDGAMVLYSIRNIASPVLVKKDDVYVAVDWISPTEMLIGSEKKIVIMNLQGNKEFMAVSQALTYGFLQNKRESLYMRIDTTELVYIVEGTLWRNKETTIEILPLISKNSFYRSEFAPSSSIVFRNQPRIIRRNGETEIPYDFRNNITRVLFGSETGGGQAVSLALDVTQSNVGFLKTVNAVYENNIRATFFINGDFLQYYPTLSRVLAGSGQEIASLFASYVDFSENPFVITQDYLRKNTEQFEQNFKQRTGKELKKIWHLPYFFVNETVREFSESWEYTLVMPDILLSMAITASSTQLINAALSNVRSGNIIALNASIPFIGNTAGSYMFNNIRILIKALHNSGFSIVPVSELEK